MNEVSLIGLFGALAGVGVVAALLMFSFFFFVKGKEDAKMKVVGLIFLAISLRLAKSIFYFLFEGIAPIGLALGFFGLASIGPLAYLLFAKDENFKKWRLAPHSLLPIGGAVVCFFVSPSLWETVLYKFATGLLALYLVGAWMAFSKHVKADKITGVWHQRLLIALVLIWSCFVYQHLSGDMLAYALGAFFCAIVVYWFFFLSLRTPVAMGRTLKINLPDEKIELVQQAFESVGVYKRPGITINELSRDLEIPAYVVSKAVKELYGKSFPETVNHFRIKEVKRALVDPANSNLKIESLAYDVGFSTPSSFYYAFKKHTGVTPTGFQKLYELQSA
ncbi:helix-turn-helix domain-containing protein [Roseivirga pacifica]|uniref:helix-turn-helix domain-containing protein n=1 Tax=Roseivirga pacifica TaxID=1267423 RepID=UPI00227B1709|nr:AraC family transcriptional regulator [Roseivirga pacifica]